MLENDNLESERADKAQQTPNQPDPKNSERKPTKKLPYRKFSSANQFKLLQAIGTLSNTELKPLMVKDIAEVAEAHPNTVSACNPFFIDIGLLTKTGHQFSPDISVVHYADRLKWEDPDAGRKFAGLMDVTWFATCLRPRMQMKALTNKEAVAFLSDASGASPKYKAQLLMLIDFLELAGLVERNGEMLSWSKAGAMDAPSEQKNQVEDEPKDKNKPEDSAELSGYRTLTIPLLDDRQPVKVLLPEAMDAEDWETFEQVYKIYIQRIKRRDVGPTAAKNNKDERNIE